MARHAVRYSETRPPAVSELIASYMPLTPWILAFYIVSAAPLVLVAFAISSLRSPRMPLRSAGWLCRIILLLCSSGVGYPIYVNARLREEPYYEWQFWPLLALLLVAGFLPIIPANHAGNCQG